MRPVTITLGVLVRDPVIDNAWPGVDTLINFNDAACPSVDGDSPSFRIEQGFVVLGFDESASDAFPAPDGWQFYPQGDAAPLIPGWAAADLEWHAATRITCSNDPDNFWIVSNSAFDVLDAFQICCGIAVIQSLGMVLKQSNSPLTEGQEYPCGTEAIFKWMAIFGSPETRNLKYTFAITLLSQDGLTELTENLVDNQPLTSTQQLVKNWPADFIGMTIAGTTLVANDATPGVGEMRVGDFDLGTIQMWSFIFDADNGDELIQYSTDIFALPGTECFGDDGIFAPSFAESFA